MTIYSSERLAGMFARHYKVLERTLKRRGLSEDAIADALQDTFMVAIERLADIRHGAERAFLIRVALNKARSLHLRRGRLVFEDDMDRYLDSVEAQGLDAVQLCNMMLSEMDDDLAEVLVLREIAGLTNPEIARRIHVPLGTVASRLRRAREQAQAALRRLQNLDIAMRTGEGRWWRVLQAEQRRMIHARSEACTLA